MVIRCRASSALAATVDARDDSGSFDPVAIAVVLLPFHDLCDLSVGQLSVSPRTEESQRKRAGEKMYVVAVAASTSSGGALCQAPSA